MNIKKNDILYMSIWLGTKEKIVYPKYVNKIDIPIKLKFIHPGQASLPQCTLPYLLRYVTDISNSACPQLNSCSPTPTTAELDQLAAFPEDRYLCLLDSLMDSKRLEQSWAHRRHSVNICRWTSGYRSMCLHDRPCFSWLLNSHYPPCPFYLLAKC